MMQAFMAVAQEGGFTAAGRRLGKSKALVSKHVGALEERLGVRLLNRTTRRVSLTEAGELYLHRSGTLLEDFDALEESVRGAHGTPSGLLRVGAPKTLGEIPLTRLITRFLSENPEIDMELLLNDRFVDLVEEGIDVAVRVTEPQDSSLIARRIAPVRMVACAAPAYLARYGRPDAPEDLEAHACIVDTNLREPSRWSFEVEGRRVMVQVQSRLRVNSALAVREAVLAGAGIGLCPSFAITADLAAGRVLVLLEPYEAAASAVYVMYPHRRFVPAKVRAFVDYMAAHLAEAVATVEREATNGSRRGEGLG